MISLIDVTMYISSSCFSSTYSTTIGQSLVINISVPLSQNLVKTLGGSNSSTYALIVFLISETAENTASLSSLLLRILSITDDPTTLI